MERIIYRITLDTHRTGIQRTLQGFETADKMARRISVNLVASGDTFEIPMTNVVAMMYVTTPNATEPSVNACAIDGNTIIYDVEPIAEEGITEMQLKVMETSVGGAKKVLVSPRFAVEVTKSNTDDEGAEQSATFTALEKAIAKADAVYGSRLLKVVIEEDFVFRAYYADGTVYENTYFVNVIKNGASMLAQSYAVGGVGVREGEDTDNAKYYSNVSRSASENANKMYDESHELLNETKLYSSYTYFNVNFETGELGYISANCDFKVNQETGNLDTNKDDAYSIDEIIASDVERFVNEKSAEIDKKTEDNVADTNQKIANANTRIDTVESIAKGATQAVSFLNYAQMVSAIMSGETDWNIGQNIYIQQFDVPDLWVAGKGQDSTQFNFIDNTSITNPIAQFGFVNVGDYVLCALETEKVELTEYAKKSEVDALRGDETGVTVSGAYQLARGMMPMDNICWLEFSHSCKYSDQIGVAVPLPFTSENSAIICFMYKMGQEKWSTYRPFWDNVENKALQSELTGTIEWGDDSTLVIYLGNLPTSGSVDVQFRIVLLKMDVG